MTAGIQRILVLPVRIVFRGTHGFKAGDQVGDLGRRAGLTGQLQVAPDTVVELIISTLIPFGVFIGIDQTAIIDLDPDVTIGGQLFEPQIPGNFLKEDIALTGDVHLGIIGNLCLPCRQHARIKLDRMITAQTDDAIGGKSHIPALHQTAGIRGSIIGIRRQDAASGVQNYRAAFGRADIVHVQIAADLADVNTPA